MGNTTFSDTYGPVAEKMRALLDYAEKNPYAYGYNDACTAFARGEADHVSHRKLCDPADQIGQSGYEYRLFYISCK